MTTSLRERRRQLLQDEILQAATEIVKERGYSAMSMDDLAARVGVSKPTLYSHFATKEDLLVAAVMRTLDRVTALVQADTTPRTPLQQLLFVLRTVLQVQVDDGALSPRPWSPEVLQVLCSRQEVVERFQRVDDAVVGLVREGVAAGEIDPRLDPLVVARAFFAMINTLHAPFMIGLAAPNPVAIVDNLLMLFERGVRAGGRAEIGD
jgi:AcrR family transcriptional regulator